MRSWYALAQVYLGPTDSPRKQREALERIDAIGHSIEELKLIEVAARADRGRGAAWAVRWQLVQLDVHPEELYRACQDARREGRFAAHRAEWEANSRLAAVADLADPSRAQTDSGTVAGALGGTTLGRKPSFAIRHGEDGMSSVTVTETTESIRRFTKLLDAAAKQVAQLSGKQVLLDAPGMSRRNGFWHLIKVATAATAEAQPQTMPGSITNVNPARTDNAHRSQPDSRLSDSSRSADLPGDADLPGSADLPGDADLPGSADLPGDADLPGAAMSAFTPRYSTAFIVGLEDFRSIQEGHGHDVKITATDGTTVSGQTWLDEYFSRQGHEVFVGLFHPMGYPVNAYRARHANAKQALLARLAHPICPYPGCSQPADTNQLHHLQEWSAGGHTSLKNLVACCRYHNLINGKGGRRLKRLLPPPHDPDGQSLAPFQRALLGMVGLSTPRGGFMVNYHPANANAAASRKLQTNIVSAVKPPHRKGLIQKQP